MKKEVVQTIHNVATPQLWWPSGQGDQILHNLHVVVLEVVGEGDTIEKTERSCWKARIGLCHVELDTEKDVSLFLLMHNE